MLECKLSTLMGTKRKSIKDIHEETGLARTTISRMYHDEAVLFSKHSVETLLEYFNCELDDLFVFTRK